MYWRRLTGWQMGCLMFRGCSVVGLMLIAGLASRFSRRLGGWLVSLALRWGVPGWHPAVRQQEEAPLEVRYRRLDDERLERPD